MQAKLNPQVPATASASSTSTKGKLNFPGFQEILDFTSAGSESSVSVTVDGDTDKEYIVEIRDLDGSNTVIVRLNGASSGYAAQYLDNTAPSSITAARFAYSGIGVCSQKGVTRLPITTPSGLLKMSTNNSAVYSSGTTISPFNMYGMVYNSTSNITSITAVSASGNFTAGTRVNIFARRSNV